MSEKEEDEEGEEDEDDEEEEEEEREEEDGEEESEEEHDESDESVDRFYYIYQASPLTTSYILTTKEFSLSTQRDSSIAICHQDQ